MASNWTYQFTAANKVYFCNVGGVHWQTDCIYSFLTCLLSVTCNINMQICCLNFTILCWGYSSPSSEVFIYMWRAPMHQSVSFWEQILINFASWITSAVSCTFEKMNAHRHLNFARVKLLRSAGRLQTSSAGRLRSLKQRHQRTRYNVLLPLPKPLSLLSPPLHPRVQILMHFPVF